MEHLIRRVRADEWQQVKELRLAAVQDPLASIAFLHSYRQEAAHPDSFWQERAAAAAAGNEVAQFVAVAQDGSWDGTVSVLVEPPGLETRFGDLAEVAQTHVVGVFVRSEVRGAGLAEALFRTALEWSWDLPGPTTQRVRLFVHERNSRAEGLYTKVGFERTGIALPTGGERGDELEIEMAVGR